jgi:hypothetical protein
MDGGPNIHNWTYFEAILNKFVNRSTHAVIRFYIHYPGEVISLPDHYIDRVDFRYYKANGQTAVSPYYGDPLLLNAIENFIRAFGKQYDGDSRIAFIQSGLIGFWGEHHCSGNLEFIPSDVFAKLVQWYQESFHITPIQIRYPDKVDAALTQNIGFHDDSFTYTTLDGTYIHI